MSNIAISLDACTQKESVTPWSTVKTSAVGNGYAIKAPAADFKNSPMAFVCHAYNKADADLIVKAVNNHEALIQNLGACYLYLLRVARGASSLQEAAETVASLKTTILEAGGRV